MDKPLLYFVAKILATIVSVVRYYSNSDTTMAIIAMLSLACIFVLEILLVRVFQNKYRYPLYKNYESKAVLITLGISIAACFLLDIDNFLLLLFILMIHGIDLFTQKNMFYQVLFVAMILSFFIFLPNLETLILTMVLGVMLLLGREIINRKNTYEALAEKHNETILELEKKIENLMSLTKTIKQTVSLEERNRIAARIHDQIGHGISGSIIMLEAALLVMKKDPNRGVESIQKAIQNLREAVDDIRSALREERTENYMIGLNDIKATLEEFKVSFNKYTELRVSGNLDYITLDMWRCIHDNLNECLTNVLKHSNATKFTLVIEVFNKIIKVEYLDNGSSSRPFTKGLGLEAIEERTVHNKGRCFFHQGDNGFRVTNIFTY
jgi:signal transduction histidine kinase